MDGVFAGGGVRAFAFIGALEKMEKTGYSFERLAGTSAGALFAGLMKAGYTSKEIYSLFEETNMDEFLDKKMSFLPFRFIKWASVYYRLGLYKGEKLEAWIKEKLKAKGIETFADIEKGSLKIIASDLTRGQILVLPDDLEKYGLIPEDFSVARAIRMSCSIPFFFEPVRLTDSKGNVSIIVDGGLLSNFPMWLFTTEEQKSLRPIIGFQLTPNLNECKPNTIDNAFEMFHSLFETMRKAHDVRYIAEEDAVNIVFIPVDEVSPTDFQITEEEVKQLIHLGMSYTEKFLKKWSY